MILDKYTGNQKGRQKTLSAVPLKIRPPGAGSLTSKLRCSQRVKSDLKPVLERHWAGGGRVSAVGGGAGTVVLIGTQSAVGMKEVQ